MKWNTDTSYGLYINGFETNDGLYVISSENRKADFMWLASPYFFDTNFVTVVGYVDTYGSFFAADNETGTAVGFRPIVCLDTYANLIKQSNGTYYLEGK